MEQCLFYTGFRIWLEEIYFRTIAFCEYSLFSLTEKNIVLMDDDELDGDLLQLGFCSYLSNHLYFIVFLLHCLDTTDLKLSQHI